MIDEDDNIIDLASIKTKASVNEFNRLTYIVDMIRDYVLPMSHDHDIYVFIEAVPFARRPTGKTYTRVEIVGVVKWMLRRELDVSVYIISATTLKKQFSGHGHAQKDDMQMRVVARFNRLVKNDNIADALALSGIGADFMIRKAKFNIQKIP